MATWTDLKELRLRIKDPLGAIALETVASASARENVASPARQTAYLQSDTGVYYVYDSDLEEWEAKDLLISDARLGTLIDLYGVASAAPRAVKDIMAELGQRLYVARTADGAGSTDYQNLSTMKEFYKDLIATMTEEVVQDAGQSTGRYLRIRNEHVGGGMHF
jgi:hypothetical protein